MTLIKKKIGAYNILLNECILIFNIIITKRKRTAIAPTYIIIKSTPKKSILNINKIEAAVQNVKIRNKTECIEFEEKKTKKLEKININIK